MPRSMPSTAAATAVASSLPQKPVASGAVPKTSGVRATALGHPIGEGHRRPYARASWAIVTS